MENITHKILYNFSVDNNLPLDAKYRIESITQQIPLHQRYVGLVCYSIEQGSLYIYEDVNTLVPLFSFLSREFTGLLNSQNYSNLLTDMLALNNLAAGDMITIFPMNVTYVFDGTKFVFRSGPYKLTNVTEYNSLADELKEPNQLVYINNEKYLINEDLTLSPEIDEITPTTDFVDGRFYSSNGQLFIYTNGGLYKIGDQIYTDENFNLTSSVFTVEHNLNTLAPLEIFLMEDGLVKFTIPDYVSIDSNTIEFESYTSYETPLKLVIKSK